MSHKAKSCSYISLYLCPFTSVLVQIDKLIYFSKYKVQESFYFFFEDFFMWIIFKVVIEFVPILFLFYFWLFGFKACGILAPWPGTKPTPGTLEGKVLTTGLPGKPQHLLNTLTSKPQFQVSDIGNLWPEDLGQSSEAMWWDSQGTFQPFAML